MKMNKKSILKEVMIFVMPLMVLYSIFFILPFFTGTYYSLFNWDGISSTKKFVGLKNYIELFTNDPDYFKSLIFTVKYVVLNVLATNILALALALILNSKLKSTKFLRTCFFLPNVISMLVVGYIWRFVFNQGCAALYEMTGLKFFNTSWLGGGNVTVVAMVVVAMWQSVGYIMIIYLSGLQMVDTTLLEAASIDGANGLQKFKNVTLPLILPSIGVNLFMVLSQSFRLFDVNLSLTGGGPGRETMGLALDIYTEGFQNNRMGYGAAKAVILFVIVIVIAVIQLKLTNPKEES
ncbi:carbohydrate ABC transporter permease [Blautia producta]|uniref:carbohydrate ABC transporter permease n=1 Tax=Blautia producta TaxID=33035 RepID=UPI0031B5C913